MRVLCIDPGEKRLGVAVSDPTGTLARPLTVLRHVSRGENAARIVRLAEEHGCERIVIGQAKDWDDRETPASRRARRLAGAVRAQTGIPVELWDEYGSTQAARQARREMGAGRAKRRGHLDDLAAAVILQSYLEAHKE